MTLEESNQFGKVNSDKKAAPFETNENDSTYNDLPISEPAKKSNDTSYDSSTLTPVKVDKSEKCNNLSKIGPTEFLETCESQVKTHAEIDDSEKS